ncbi:serine hydrolase domain-containing protein [Kaistella antarctica]|uniref:6-aminohexanoate-dimer hydrolase n=1 Tax=Kaistella antarctica TaxID=266748 RepID=A0A448NSS7_9FLAO|nr:serine hydrolase [Kaistella antarctica]KEY17938.1 beta-lactamase [Kaistella antarctica]SEV81404.1 CubicO group peptidase, beta-lactamase class C family [Kaistella antarctica]VEI00328.1 6-aminohexanoate-dimer hydrolase [Kaistella antarctica]
MLKKIVKGILVGIAALIALAYTFGYDYLFKGIRETYLRGEAGSSIDDGTYFKSHTIAKGNTIPWVKDSIYNKKTLPKNLVDELKQTKTASLLVIKNGKLVHEEYWDGYNQNSKTNSFSMAKAITVMLVGKAIEQKKIKSIDEKFADFFQNYNNVEFGKYLTLADLAQMEAGLNWKEDYNNPFLPNAKAYYGKSLEEAVLLRGFKAKPGTNFEYQSGATQLLGFALRKSLDKTIAEYASETLWQLLGMEQNAEWNTDDFGMEKTFCCINSNSRDFAKLGQLLLNDGQFDGKQILNSNFIQEMRTPTKLSKGAYGLGLWINEDVAIKHYYFRGLYGQYIIMIPEKQMVIVRTGMNKNETLDGKSRPKEVDFLVNEVVNHFN